jgi:hypothetical protein
MITEFIDSATGAYALSLLGGVGVGLIATDRSERGLVASSLISVVFVLLASTRTADAVFAAPLYVLTVVFTSLVVDVGRFAGNPLLVDEPLWRRAFLVFAHPGALRDAAREQDGVLSEASGISNEDGRTREEVA